MTSSVPTTATSRFATRVSHLTPPQRPGSVEPRHVVTGPASRLLALGPEPLVSATTAVRTALLACQDAAEITDGPEADLHDAFVYAIGQLDLAARMMGDTVVLDGAALAGVPSPFPYEPRAPLGGRVLDVAPLASHEAVRGLRATVRETLGQLAAAVRKLGSVPRRGVPGVTVLPWLAEVALAASLLERVADVVVAHVSTTLDPGTPELPGVGGDVELYPGGRTLPVRRWAQRSRVRFTPGRVEIVSSTGRHSVGQTSPIGSLLWVAPPTVTDVEARHEAAESRAAGSEHDALGTIHVLDAVGRSLVALTVADWSSQPSTAVDQALVDTTAGGPALGAARGVYALESIGFPRGAATIGVPLARGVAHPPPAPDGLGLVRAGEDRSPYRGRDLSPARVVARRRGRSRWWNRDLGPGSVLSGWVRPVAPWLLALAPLLLWPGGGRTPFQLVVLTVTLLALLEPWVTWLVEVVRDLVPRPARRAAYTAGRRGNRLVLTDRFIVVRTASGHETWLPGPQDADLGVTSLVRLLSGDRAWGFALADARGRWRFVLPAAEWAPQGRYGDLEAFARAARLELADQEAAPLPRLHQESVERTSAAASDRTTGPHPRGLVILGFFATPAALISLAGPTRSQLLALVTLLLTYGGAAVLSLLARRRRAS